MPCQYQQDIVHASRIVNIKRADTPQEIHATPKTFQAFLNFLPNGATFGADTIDTGGTKS
jgi:hypothetical protein